MFQTSQLLLSCELHSYVTLWLLRVEEKNSTRPRVTLVFFFDEAFRMLS